jgi:poly(hydroxyalkanoate) depolymerase family esterase
MARKSTNAFWNKAVQRTLKTITRSAVRAGTQAIKASLKQPPTPAAKRIPAAAKRKPAAQKTPGTPAASAGHWTQGIAGARRYHLFKPPGVRSSEHLPLVVMLHGCGQDAAELAASTQMNKIAARERFLVLYPEQDRLANMQGCWNWFDTRAGRAQREADSVDATIEQVCQKHPVDPTRIVLAGLSAGASLATLMAIRHPWRYQAVATHSGVPPGAANSTATALSAMRGRRAAGALAPLAVGHHLPALLVIQGSLDSLVAPSNGAGAAHLWATREGASASPARTVQRGARYAATLTDFKTRGRLVATLCLVNGLGHAWSGGAAGHPYSDPKGPDASRMIWAFAVKAFARSARISALKSVGAAPGGRRHKGRPGEPAP